MEFYEVVNKRRTIRDFENKAIPQEVLERPMNTLFHVSLLSVIRQKMHRHPRR